MFPALTSEETRSDYNCCIKYYLFWFQNRLCFFFFEILSVRAQDQGTGVSGLGCQRARRTLSAHGIRLPNVHPDTTLWRL